MFCIMLSITRLQFSTIRFLRWTLSDLEDLHAGLGFTGLLVGFLRDSNGSYDAEAT